MKALKFFAKEDIRLLEVPDPVAGPGKVKVKVRQSGICGSDVHEYTDGPRGTPTRPHPVTGKMVPDITLGHEFSGEIAAIGTGVTGFTVGDRVTVCPSLPCRQCKFCKEGRPTLCDNIVFLGLSDDGAFAEYVIAPASAVYLLPDDMTYERAAFCEPLAVSIHGVRLGQIGLGANVAVTGAGTIGLLAMQAAFAAGASKVFMIEPVEKRRKLALELGATAALDPSRGDVSKEIRKLTSGVKADVTIEAAGSQNAMLMTPRITSKGGKIIQLGVMVGSCDFPFFDSWMREQSIIPSNAYDVDFPIALALLSGKKITVEPLISAKIGLDDAIEKGFKQLVGPNRTEFVKILVSM